MYLRETIIKGIEEQTDLNDLVFQDTDLTLHYHGLAEYGHNEILQEVQQTDNGQIYTYHGVMNDGTGRTDEKGDPLSFQREIYVIDNLMTSRIESEHYEDIKTSLINERIVHIGQRGSLFHPQN